MSEAILVQGLTKTYGGKPVVDHLELSVTRGTVFGLLGANGAGKSTAIECMLGTKQADSGTVRLLGQDPRKRRRALFQRIGVQLQEGDYHREIKVSELCGETASLYRSPADWRELCERFGIGDKAVLLRPCDAAAGRYRRARHGDPHFLRAEDGRKIPRPLSAAFCPPGAP